MLATRAVQRQFREREAGKTYLAVLLGRPAQDAFECSAPIAEHPHDRTRSVVVLAASEEGGAASGEEGGAASGEEGVVQPKVPRPSHTRFEVVARGERATVCRVHPLTGRMHQIRVHAEALGHPLAGDNQYGLEEQPTEPRCSRLLLHALSLRITHPATGEMVEFTAPPPAEFLREAAALGVPEDALAAALATPPATEAELP